MADLVTRLLLNTQQFDNNLGKSTKQIQGFQQKIQGFSNFAISSFTKFAGGIGIALTAGEAFNKALRSCQATADLFDNNLNAAKDTVDSFFRSLVTGDWNVFNEGILGAYRNLKDLSMMMDELADKKLSLGYIKADDLKDMERFEQIAKDTNKTYDERINAVQNMQGVVNHLNKSIKETNDLDIAALNKSYASKSGLNINREDLDYFFKNTNFKGELTTAANDAYKEYLRLQKEVQSKTKANRYDVNVYGYDPSRKSQREYAEAVKALNVYKQQNDFLIKQGWLTEETDDNRKQTVDRLKEQLEAEKEIYSLQKRADETRRSVVSSNKPVATTDSISTTTNIIKTEVIPSGSITELKKQIASLKTEFENATNDGMRAGLMAAINEAETQLKMMQLRASKMDLLSSKSIQIEAKNPLEGLDTSDLDKYNEETIFKKDGSTLDYLSTIGSLMNNIAGATNNSTAAWMNYFSSILSGTAALLPLLASVFEIKAMEGIASQSKLPWPMNLIAMAATAAGLIASIANIPKFANGGIFTGNSFIGDMNIARVNSGEMILNNRQQRNLFNLLNGNGGITNDNVKEIKLKIEGRDLVSVINSENFRTSKFK